MVLRYSCFSHRGTPLDGGFETIFRGYAGDTRADMYNILRWKPFYIPYVGGDSALHYYWITAGAYVNEKIM